MHLVFAYSFENYMLVKLVRIESCMWMQIKCHRNLHLEVWSSDSILWVCVNALLMSMGSLFQNWLTTWRKNTFFGLLYVCYLLLSLPVLTQQLRKIKNLQILQVKRYKCLSFSACQNFVLAPKVDIFCNVSETEFSNKGHFS